MEAIREHAWSITGWLFLFSHAWERVGQPSGRNASGLCVRVITGRGVMPRAVARQAQMVRALLCRKLDLALTFRIPPALGFGALVGAMGQLTPST